MSEESDKLEAIQVYLNGLTSPETMEFESAEAQRVAKYIAGKVRSIITGEKFPDDRAVSDRERRILEAFISMTNDSQIPHM